ncbi:hypothetical protein CEE39_06455 [bacterium (candidate division B38) B3_B38]|nr:MAG: hypothetical protein CEE39_06455 [bacterium (candidate division B38) B3_B38]
MVYDISSKPLNIIEWE